jgi:hypothetical protein
MVDLIKKPLFLYIVAVIVLAAAGIVTVKNRSANKVIDGNPSMPAAVVATTTPTESDEGQTREEVASLITAPDHMNLFTSDPRNNTSNIVGYIAGGAFVINLSDWIPQKWSMKDYAEGEKGSILFTPKENIQNRDFSDITLRITSTNEENNASYLAEKEMGVAVEKDAVRTIAVIKSLDGNTDIHHIEKLVGNTCELKFFFDGNKSKTAIVHFSASSTNCQKYSARVKEFIQGFSNGTPQG